MDETALMTKLMTDIPELKPLMHQHLVDQEGEMQPYVLMGDVARWAHENAARGADRVSPLTRWLDNQFAAGDEAVRDLIGIGFVEMLPETPEGDAVFKLLGPHLREVAHEMHLFESWPAPE